MNEESHEPDGEARQVDLLVFLFGDWPFAVEARKVESVIAWRDPVPLPRDRTGLRGVIQDRGRIVCVLSHPAGAGAEADDPPARILVCPTEGGYVGLPASRTRTIGTVTVDGGLVSGAVVDTSERALTFVDPEQVARALRSGTDGRSAAV